MAAVRRKIAAAGARRAFLAGQHLLQPQPCDRLHLGRGGGQLRRARIRQPLLEGGQDLRLVEPPDGDDEGEAEFREIGFVQLREARALRVGQRVEPGGGLLRGRLGGEPPGDGKLAGKVRVGLEDRQPALRSRHAEDGAHGAVQPPCGVLGGADAAVEDRLGDPRGMLEDGTEALDEALPRHFGWPFAFYVRRTDVHAPAPVQDFHILTISRINARDFQFYLEEASDPLALRRRPS